MITREDCPEIFEVIDLHGPIRVARVSSRPPVTVRVSHKTFSVPYWAATEYRMEIAPNGRLRAVYVRRCGVDRRSISKAHEDAENTGLPVIDGLGYRLEFSDAYTVLYHSVLHATSGEVFHVDLSRLKAQIEVKKEVRNLEL